MGQFLTQAKAGYSGFIRPWAGMRGQPITFEMAASLNLPAMSGMIISEVHDLSPFAKAGIQVGDIITKVDGLDINSPAEMLYRMSVVGIGTTVDIGYLSQGIMQSSRIDLVEIPNLEAKQVTLLLGLRLGQWDLRVLVSQHHTQLKWLRKMLAKRLKNMVLKHWKLRFKALVPVVRVLCEHLQQLASISLQSVMLHQWHTMGVAHQSVAAYSLTRRA